MSDQNDKLIWGGRAIAEETNLGNERAVFHLAKQGLLPVQRVGGKLVGKASELRDPASWPKKGK